MSVAALLSFVLLFQTGQTGPVAPPRLGVKLFAAHESVAPGGQTELALELEIQPGWHIYHPIILDTGDAPRIAFDLPPGVTVGELRYPAPTLAESRGMEYFEYTGRLAVLINLKLDANAAGIRPGEPLKISVQVSALACTDQSCVPTRGEATLSLPVTAEPGKPANEKLFTEARAALPPPLAEARFLKGSELRVSHEKIPVGGKAVLAAVFRVQAEHHIQDRNPLTPDFIPSRLFIEPRDGFEFGEQVWPLAKTRDVPGFGKVREQAGEFVVRVPLTITDKEFKPGPVALRVLFQYQCCTDSGQCYAMMMAEGLVRFEVVPAGAAVTASNDPIFQMPATTGNKVGSQAGGPPGSSPGGLQVAGTAAPPMLLWVLLLAFAGGAILNIMPCVLPVISLKIFGFMRQAGEDRGRIFRMGLVYALGIEFSFLVLALLMVYLKIPWGGLMQYPGYIIIMGAVVLAFALSLLGVFEIQLPGAAMDAANAAASREGYVGAFFNGLLATALATPCTAPLLGPALGFLAQLPPLTRSLGILTVGLGLAAPYLLLTAFPGWLRFLPKPGGWMVTFKQIMGFVLLATVVWLMSILVAMVKADEIAAVLAFFCAVGLACWLLGRLSLNAGFGRTVVTWAGAVAILLGGWFGGRAVFATEWGQIPWQEWKPGIADQLAAEGYTVYVDYTARWCLTCQTNKKLILETDAVRKKLKELKIVPIKADFTQYDPKIQAELAKHGRDGVPLNIVVPAGKPGQAIVLPEVLTQGLVLSALEQAGASQKEANLAKVEK